MVSCIYEKISLLYKDKKIVYVIFLVFIFVLGWYGYTCFGEKVCQSETIEKFVRHDLTIAMPNGAVVAEVVDTKSLRALVLSGRSKMRDNEGMLFVFDTSGRYGFWMKDMNFPLDIIWINQNGVVVKTESNLTPESYPKTFINDAEALYVLEMNAGRAGQYGLFLGSKVGIGE